MIKVVIDDSDLQKIIGKLASMGENMRKNVAEAINKGLDQAKPYAEGMVSQTYNVGTPSLGVKHASAGDLSGYLKASGGMKPVTEFDPVSDGARIGQTVSVSILRGTRKPILPGSRGVGRGAFMIGDGRVMERRQDSRFPIYPVYTIGIPQMLGSKKVSEPVRDMMSAMVMEQVVKLWLANI